MLSQHQLSVLTQRLERGLGRVEMKLGKIELPDLSSDRDAIEKLEKRVGALERKLSKLRKRAESYLEE